MDLELALRLRRLGILDAAREMNLDVATAFGPIFESEDHPYSRFRWSLTSDEVGGLTINAVPPEEETGWTPWERWHGAPSGPVHESWVRDAGSQGWVQLQTGDPSLAARGVLDGLGLADRFERARLSDALTGTGIDVDRDLLAPLDADAETRYRRFRWVVIPHHTAHTPVVYAIPPMHLSDSDPWETWYVGVAGGPPLHHVHFTAPRPESTGCWREGVGAPGRPPEVCGVDWYWHTADVRPALAPG